MKAEKKREPLKDASHLYETERRARDEREGAVSLGEKIRCAVEIARLAEGAGGGQAGDYFWNAIVFCFHRFGEFAE